MRNGRLDISVSDKYNTADYENAKIFNSDEKMYAHMTRRRAVMHAAVASLILCLIFTLIKGRANIGRIAVICAVIGVCLYEVDRSVLWRRTGMNYAVIISPKAVALAVRMDDDKTEMLVPCIQVKQYKIESITDKRIYLSGMPSVVVCTEDRQDVVPDIEKSQEIVIPRIFEKEDELLSLLDQYSEKKRHNDSK